MTKTPPFTDDQCVALAQHLGECGTGAEISRAFNSRGLKDTSGESTKWKRLHSVFAAIQAQDHAANGILAFISTYLSPALFVGRGDQFESYRTGLNARLAFAGLEYGADGEFRTRQAARTLTEAEARVRTIESKFRGRRLHPEVLKYCRSELMQDNYFHAVFEATKGLAQRLRDITALQLDGAALADRVFAVNQPLLAFNSLRTETEQSEHKGLSMLIKGAFAAVRNPLAHQPKLLWEGEDDAADYLTLLSLLHRRLDDAVLVPPKP